MERPTVVGARPETPAEEARRKWFEKGVQASPDTLEAAARQLIGLATTLLGVLLGVLSLAGDPPPDYLSRPEVQGLGVAVVTLLLLCLLAALLVVLPRRWEAASGDPALQEEVFRRLLGHKSRALTAAALAFWLAAAGVGGVVVVALSCF